MADLPATFADIIAAKQRISKYLHKTPVFTSSTADELSGKQLFFKADSLQKTGSFKARGALNAVRQRRNSKLKN